VDDRRFWVTGFDNSERRMLYEKQAQRHAEMIGNLQRKLDELSTQDKAQRERERHCQTLVNTQWQEIDAVSLMQQIDTLEKRLLEVKTHNTELKEIEARIEKQRKKVAESRQNWIDARVNLKQTLSQKTEAENSLREYERNASELSPEQESEIAERFASQGKITLETVGDIAGAIIHRIDDEATEVRGKIVNCETEMRQAFGSFRNKWPVESASVDVSIESASEFIAILTRLENDGLPEYETRFFDLLRTQSMQNLTALNTYLREARKSIRERMDLVNESLAEVPFNKNGSDETFLTLRTDDKRLPEVAEFQKAMTDALEHSFSEEENRSDAERRFDIVRDLVKRLRGESNEDKRWRDMVLDVRTHVEFIGVEKDKFDNEIEVYRSGTGKSGGQRQKLATTCLAAALRYQLGGNERGYPMYAPVVLDEAFDKADNEFTTLAMNIFRNFGFQMIVATPLKSVMTLEPFIGGACFVDMNDRKTSSVLLIEYDAETERLKMHNLDAM
jgi:uncharacterized protein YPO0396